MTIYGKLGAKPVATASDPVPLPVTGRGHAFNRRSCSPSPRLPGEGWGEGPEWAQSDVWKRAGMERIEMAGISVEALIAGAGPPLLFLHGGDYVAQNRPLLDRLAQRFRVIAPRHPGFGTTPRPA